ncbi:hypothetical protein [Streptococcus agalactiae]|uniref:hypothetical protein n=1 Tax=Streptococcus agalactiae TaxID=1311 RepID=UPI00085C9BFF|nr:hypothetical protein [Streptococcus agalactiae]
MKTFYVSAEYKDLDIGYEAVAENIHQASIEFIDYLVRGAFRNEFVLDELLIKEIKEIEVENDK